MHRQVRPLFLATFLYIIAIPAHAQVADTQKNDDPFESDSLFTKPLKDWFTPEELKGRAKKTRDQFFLQKSVDGTYRDLTGYGDKPGLFGLQTTAGWLRFNRVDGVYLGFYESPLEWSSKKDAKLYGSIGYSFGREEFLYNVGMERFFGFMKIFKAGIEYHNITDTEDAWRTGWNETSLTSFFSGYDFMDYYHRMGASIYTIFRAGNLVEFVVSYRDDKVSNLNLNTRYTMFGKKSVYRPNPLLVDAVFENEHIIQQIAVALKFNPQQKIFDRRFSLSGEITAELGDRLGGFESTLRYDKFESEMRMMYRLDPSAILRFRIRAGGINGNAPPFEYFYLGGPSTLRASAFKQYAGTGMALLNLELNLGSQSAAAGQDWLDFVTDLDKFKVVVFLDAGWTGGTQPDAVNPFKSFDKFTPDDIVTAAGIGLNANLIRFELAWPTNDFRSSPFLWVRLNPTF